MKTEGLITIKNPKSVVSEAFRNLRTNIQYSNIDDKIRSIVITSSTVGEGKTVVSSNLAVSIAFTGKKVLILDCDLRKPNIHKKMGILNLKGLTNVLIGEDSFEDVVQRSEEIPELHILTSGPIPPNPSELLGSKKMEELLNNLEDKYDMIVIDSPPIGIVTDAAILSTIADGVLLVTAAGKTEIDTAKRSKELLENVNANIIGVVLNKVSMKNRSYYKYGYYKYDEEQKQENEQENKG